MASWDESEKVSDEGGGGGKYVRLADDGDFVVGMFVGDPEIHKLVWNQKLGRYEDLTPEREAAGEKGSPKFSINFWVPAEKAMKIIEVNNNTFKDIITCKKKYGLDKWYFEIKRNGKKGDNKTTYSVLPETQISGDELKAILAVDLHDLKKNNSDSPSDNLAGAQKAAAKTNGATNGTAAAAPAQAAPAAAAAAAPAAPAGPPTIPIEDAKAIIERLRPKTKDQQGEFLAAFGVTQIKAIKASDRAAAFAMLDKFEGKAAAPAEIDPFAEP